MRKGSELIGTKVVANDTGQEIEKIEDLIFDSYRNSIIGFLVDEGGWFSNARVLPAAGVRAISPEEIVALSETVVANAEQFADSQHIIDSKYLLLGPKLVTPDGRDLGTIVDLYFDEKTLKIEGYEVFGGLFADAFWGSSFVPAFERADLSEQLVSSSTKLANAIAWEFHDIESAMQAGYQNWHEEGQTAAEQWLRDSVGVAGMLAVPSAKGELRAEVGETLCVGYHEALDRPPPTSARRYPIAKQLTTANQPRVARRAVLLE